MGLGDLVSALSPRDLSTLSNFELGEILNEIDIDDARLRQEAVRVQRLLAEAEVRLIADPSDVEAKMIARTQRAAFKAIEIQLAGLSKRQSRIQTIMRTSQAIQ